MVLVNIGGVPSVSMIVECGASCNVIDRQLWESLKENKNTLSSVESRLLGHKFFVKSAGAVILLFRSEYKTSVICHNVNTE